MLTNNSQITKLDLIMVMQDKSSANIAIIKLAVLKSISPNLISLKRNWSSSRVIVGWALNRLAIVLALALLFSIYTSFVSVLS